MGIKDKTIKHVKKNFNVTHWLGLKSIIGNARVVKATSDDVLSLAKDGSTSQDASFEAMLKRLGWQEKDIIKRQKQSFKMFKTYVFGAVAMLIYQVYLLLGHHWSAFIYGLLILAMLLAFSFRESIVYMQCKHRVVRFSWKCWWETIKSAVGGNQ